MSKRVQRDLLHQKRNAHAPLGTARMSDARALPHRITATRRSGVDVPEEWRSEESSMMLAKELVVFASRHGLLQSYQHYYQLSCQETDTLHN